MPDYVKPTLEETETEKSMNSTKISTTVDQMDGQHNKIQFIFNEN